MGCLSGDYYFGSIFSAVFSLIIASSRKIDTVICGIICILAWLMTGTLSLNIKENLKRREFDVHQKEI